MTHCDRNLAADLVLDFLRTPAETTCGHLAVYDNNIREYWTGKFKLLSKKFSRPKVKSMPFKNVNVFDVEEATVRTVKEGPRNGIRAPSDRLADNTACPKMMCLEGSMCNLCIQRPAHQT